MQPADLRKQVMVNELPQLRVPNCGKLFKTTLRAYLEQGTIIAWSQPSQGGLPLRV
jgi:hypothetical protein